MKSKELKVYNLPSNRKSNLTIDAKPTFLLVIIALIGLMIFILQKESVLGITFIALAFFGMLFLPHRILIEFCDEYAILFNKASHSECKMIYYDEIILWYYRSGISYDELIIELNDGTSEIIECFNRYKIEKIMQYYAKDKMKKMSKKK